MSSRARDEALIRGASEQASAWLGSEVEARPLYGDTDLNFAVAAPGESERAVLKLSPRQGPAEARQLEALIALEAEVLDHLAAAADSDPDRERGLHLAFPRRLRSSEGELSRTVSIAGSSYALRVLSWVPGRLLDELEHYPRQLLRSLGRGVASVDRALQGLTTARARRTISWDLRQFPQVAGLLPAIGDREQRQLAEALFDKLEGKLPRLDARPRSLIHNDGGNQHNMLVDPEGDRVTGIIDFGDAVETATICGLGITCAYASFGAVDLPTALVEVAAGYDECLPLVEEDLELLPSLVAMRFLQTVSTAARRAADDPSDAYATVSAEPAWRGLAAWSELGETKLEDALRSGLARARNGEST